MTEERQDAVLNFGFEVMKYMGAPSIALWLEADGWAGGTILVAERVGPEHVKVRLKPFETMFIMHDQNPN